MVFQWEQGRKEQSYSELVEGAVLFRPGGDPMPSEVTPKVKVLDVSDDRPPRVLSITPLA